MKSLILDLDGVLTDGRQYITESGDKLFKRLHCRDMSAIRYLVSKGWSVTVISADDWEGAAKWCEKLGAKFVYSRDKQDEDLPWSESIGIGDDFFFDAPWLHKCKVAFTVADAGERMRSSFPALSSKGGEGVVEELIWKGIAG